MSRVCAECAFGVVRAQEGVFKGVSTRGGGGGSPGGSCRWIPGHPWPLEAPPI